MDKLKVIKDIRMYESNNPNVDGNSIPGEIGKLYNLNKEIVVPICQRIARKLNEYNFLSGDFDHIYINLTPYIKDNIIISNRKPEKWLQYIDFGLNPSEINILNIEDQSKKLKYIIFKSLDCLYSENFVNLELIKKVKNEIEKYDTELEILYKSKETGNYCFKIFYQIKPNGNPSCVLFEYKNKKNNYYFKNKIFNFDYYEDIYYLIGNVKISDKEVTFIPKNTYTASLCNKRYNFPLSFNLI